MVFDFIFYCVTMNTHTIFFPDSFATHRFALYRSRALLKGESTRRPIEELECIQFLSQLCLTKGKLVLRGLRTIVGVIFGVYGTAEVIASTGNQAQSCVDNGHGKNRKLCTRIFTIGTRYFRFFLYYLL